MTKKEMINTMIKHELAAELMSVLPIRDLIAYNRKDLKVIFDFAMQNI